MFSDLHIDQARLKSPISIVQYPVLNLNCALQLPNITRPMSIFQSQLSNFKCPVPSVPAWLPNNNCRVKNCLFPAVQDSLSNIKRIIPNCPISNVHFQLYKLTYSITIVHCQLSILDCSISTVHCKLSILDCLISTLHLQLSNFNCPI